MNNIEKNLGDIVDENGPSAKLGRRTAELAKKAEIRTELNSQLKDSERVRDAFRNICGASGLSNFLIGYPYAGRFEEAFSGDGASLFMLVDFPQEDGSDKTELVKIGWGEFSKQTFTKGDKSLYSDYVPEFKNGKDYSSVAGYEVLRNLPFDVYCVDQRDSYFADVDTQEDMAYHPKKYLQENALFVARNGQVTVATRRDSRIPMDEENRVFQHDISPISEADALDSISKMQEFYQETVERLSEQDGTV